MVWLTCLSPFSMKFVRMVYKWMTSNRIHNCGEASDHFARNHVGPSGCHFSGIIAEPILLARMRRRSTSTDVRMASARKDRTTYTSLDVRWSVDKLDAVASKRAVPFTWDGTFYEKPKRGGGPYLQGLESGSDALEVFAEGAPSGYPTLSSVRKILI